VQDIGPLDVRDYLEAAKANGLSTATLKQHMAASSFGSLLHLRPRDQQDQLKSKR
jgi:hypothetical protein